MTHTRLDTIIVTRPEPDGSAFADMVRQGGFETSLNPVMEIVLRKGVPDLGDFSGLAFTSANGVRAFCHWRAHYQSAIFDVPVFAVGPVTAAIAHDYGFSNVFEAGGDVEALAHIIATKTVVNDQTRILHIAGSDRKGDLAALLTRAAIPLTRRVFYDAKSRPWLTPQTAMHLRINPEARGIAFFSPRTVGLFAQQCLRADLGFELTKATALCLSAAVAKRAVYEGFPRNRVHIAKAPTANSVYDLLTP